MMRFSRVCPNESNTVTVYILGFGVVSLLLGIVIDVAVRGFEVSAGAMI